MTPIVGVIMGSISDLKTMQAALDLLDEFGIPREAKIVSAHRTPAQMAEYAQTARERGLKVIIAGAGGAAHLPGMVASQTTLPVIGVPVETQALKGLDSLYSIVQIPAGIPVATMAIGGAANAALMAIRILATESAELAGKLDEYAASLEKKVAEMNEELSQKN
jgi:5-(carboxyamino)imidazole ribonucleotide mutase